MKAYALLMELEASARIEIGKLGIYDFPRGYYVYVGSAKRNLDARIARHLRRGEGKVKRWHVDYLLEKAVIKRIFLYDLGECQLNQEVFELPGATSIAPGFGSSDCRAGCGSHLAHFPEEPDLSELGYRSMLSSIKPEGKKGRENLKG